MRSFRTVVKRGKSLEYGEGVFLQEILGMEGEEKWTTFTAVFGAAEKSISFKFMTSRLSLRTWKVIRCTTWSYPDSLEMATAEFFRLKVRRIESAKLTRLNRQLRLLGS